jgi:hypothetical protein
LQKDVKEAAASAFQLRLTLQNSSKTERVLIVSGAANFWKLSQFIATAFGVSTGKSEHHSQKGKTETRALFRVDTDTLTSETPLVVSESEAASPTTSGGEVLVGSKRSCEAVAGKACSFIDEKALKVCHIFQRHSGAPQVSAGSTQAEDSKSTSSSVTAQPAKTVCVRFYVPTLQAPVAVTLDGIRSNKAKYPLIKNAYPLPRIVEASDDLDDCGLDRLVSHR